MRYYENERECIDLFREEYEFLSNFYPALMEFEGIEFYNAEAAYQAQKCRNVRGRCQASGKEGRMPGGLERGKDSGDAGCGKGQV